MHLMPALGQAYAQLGGQYAAAAVGWIADHCDFHAFFPVSTRPDRSSAGDQKKSTGLKRQVRPFKWQYIDFPAMNQPKPQRPAGTAGKPCAASAGLDYTFFIEKLKNNH